MRVSKVIKVLILTIVMPAALSAQIIKSAEKKAEKGWQNLSFTEDGVYGASIDKAYDFLKSNKPKKRVIVAIIGTGMDIEHEALAHSIWSNPKEKDNGKDDDKNGLIDDINGWNYLGNSKGEVLDAISKEGMREFMRLKDKYNGIYPSNIKLEGDYKLLKFNKEKGEIEEAGTSSNIDAEEYNYFREKIIPESGVGSSFLGTGLHPFTKYWLDQMDRRIRAAYPNPEVYDTLTIKSVASFWDHPLDAKMGGEKGLYRVALQILRYAGMSTKSDLWCVNYRWIIDVQQPAAEGRSENAIKKALKDDRKVVGDNYLDIRDTKYGNNVLMTENAGLGTMIGGIVAANRSGNEVKGVADNVQLMTLRVEGATGTNSGEPYLKDVALAIRYAVDHGADIIQMTKGNTLAPPSQLAWVNDALLYAEQKGVLIVQPVEDYAVNLDVVPFYPTKNISPIKALNNFIVVAASDSEGNPLLSANYGKKSLDLFAPGVQVYSSYIGNTYRTEAGSRLAAAMVTGVAALIKSYYPKLTGAQIKQLIVDNVTSRAGEEVEKELAVVKNGVISGSQKDLIDFDELSVSNGILNAYKAIEAASKIK